MILECVVNVSEGRQQHFLRQLGSGAGDLLLDLHHDASHHRAVLTLAGPPEPLQEAVRRLTAEAVSTLDLRSHEGVHPRFGVVDVVPFVPLGDGPATPRRPDLAPAVAERDRFARWVAAELGVACSLYGPLPGGRTRTLPELRSALSRGEPPDFLPSGRSGAYDPPSSAAPAAGVVAAGAREPLVAYNVWLGTDDVALARRIAAELRSPSVRALGLTVEDAVQVSCNLIDPWVTGPLEVFRAVEERALASGVRIRRAELVGLMPAEVWESVPPADRRRIGLGGECTIEERLSPRYPGFRRPG